MVKKVIPQIAVIIPCYNEALTVGTVVSSFKKSLPEATVYVFDNNSSDNTTEIASRSGAIVRKVSLPGKGNVVRRMFADVDADIYVMVDGDATYDASSAPKLVEFLVCENLDMVVGCRVEDSKDNKNYRPGHRTGNRLLTGFVQRIFGGNFTDMLSGYRVFSRRFAKSFPVASTGFEIETELTVFTLEQKLQYGEVATPYSERPDGSESKLSTYKDGIKILKMIINLYSNERPAQFWGLIGMILFLIAVIFIAPVMVEYFQTHEVMRFPTLIVSSILALGAFLSFVMGIVLRTVTRGRGEAKHLAYLSVPTIKNEKD